MLDMKKSIESAQGARYLAAHNRFHFGIYKMSQLPIVQDVIEGAWLRCGPTLNLALPEYKPGLKRYSHHVDALNALKIEMRIMPLLRFTQTLKAHEQMSMLC